MNYIPIGTLVIVGNKCFFIITATARFLVFMPFSSGHYAIASIIIVEINKSL